MDSRSEDHPAEFVDCPHQLDLHHTQDRDRHHKIPNSAEEEYDHRRHIHNNAIQTGAIAAVRVVLLN